MLGVTELLLDFGFVCLWFVFLIDHHVVLVVCVSFVCVCVCVCLFVV